MEFCYVNLAWQCSSAGRDAGQGGWVLPVLTAAWGMECEMERFVPTSVLLFILWAQESCLSWKSTPFMLH